MLKKILISLIAVMFGPAAINATAVETNPTFKANVIETDVVFMAPDIVKISRVPDRNNPGEETGSLLPGHKPIEVKKSVNPDGVRYESDSLIVEVNNNGAVKFYNALTGKLYLEENAETPVEIATVVRESVIYDDATARIIDTANGKVTVKDEIRRDTIGTDYSYLLNFDMGNPGALYGLGSHMEGYMNLLGKTQYLVQHNLKVAIPVIVTPAGYGLMVDAGCAMKFSSAQNSKGNYDGKFELDAADRLDYYFIKGDKLDDVVAGYRSLTGQVSMMPRYLFGYIQSKERYQSQQELIDVASEYKKRNVPLDMIVQDWCYWPEGWGYMKLNPVNYPDPKALTDSLHAMDVKLMISIWPNPQSCPQNVDFTERGYMLPNSAYDVFNPEARKYYWDTADREFFSHGFDAWWCDCSEPVDGDWNWQIPPVDGHPYSKDDHQRRWELNKDILSATVGAKRCNLYSLYHAQGIYENQRATTDEKRVVNLTRSSFPGQQRYATIVWNGDTDADWESFRRQIPSGLNYMATGNPYWTVDVGCFFTGADDRWFRQGKFPEGVNDEGYREFYTRMFQWAAFLPVLRSHGTDTPREIWRFGEHGTPYYDAILSMINLRYSLVPYIYSMAAATYSDNYTMTRLLAFDFPNDTTVYDIADQFMMGDILVCPVTSPGVKSRKLYLPADSAPWTDFWTGEKYEGGQWIDAAADLDRLPLFVRAGAIIPMVEPGNSTVEQASRPLTINVYPGRDNEFALYHDSGDSYDFEKGEYCRLRMKWDDAARKLNVDSEGTYPSPVYNIKVH